MPHEDNKVSVKINTEEGEKVVEVDKEIYNKIRSDARLGFDLDVKQRLAKHDTALGLDLENQKGYKAIETALENAMAKVNHLTQELEQVKKGKGANQNIDIEAELRKKEAELQKQHAEQLKSMQLNGAWSQLKSHAIKNGLKDNYQNGFENLIKSKYNIQVDNTGKVYVTDSQDSVIYDNGEILTLDKLAGRLVNEYPELHVSQDKNWTPSDKKLKINAGLGKSDEGKASSFELIERGVEELQIDLQKTASRNVIY